MGPFMSVDKDIMGSFISISSTCHRSVMGPFTIIDRDIMGPFISTWGTTGGVKTDQIIPSFTFTARSVYIV
jgi:hypothetical protein